MTLCMVLFVLYFLPFRRYLALGLIVVLSGIVMATFSDVFQGVIDAAGRSLQIIEVRMRSTLLNESGFRLDPSIGRKEEALAALYAFSEISADISYIFGRGFGYAFDHISYQKYSASTHVHITPVAFFIRNGFIGAFFYAYLFVLLSLCSLKLLFSMNKNRVAFVYAFIALIWITSSTFAGTIVNPVFWWVTGLVLGFSKKRASSGQQIRTRRVNV